MIKGSGSYINPLAKTIRGRTSGAAAAGEAASMAGAMAKGRGKAPVSEFVPAAQGVVKPKPQPPTTYTDQPQPPSAYLDQLETDGRKSIPPPFNRVKMPNTEKYETFVQLPYKVPSDEPVVGMPKHNAPPPMPDLMTANTDENPFMRMRDVIRQQQKSYQPAPENFAMPAPKSDISNDDSRFNRMNEMMSQFERPPIEQSYKRGGYVSKGGKLNLGSSRSSTGSKSKKSSNW